MRISELEHRIVLDRSKEIEMFTEELNFYRNYNRYPVELYGNNVVNIYKYINLQILATTKCNFKCKFCIERSCDNNRGIEHQPLDVLKYLLEQYNQNSIYPNISITGGEPSLEINYLRELFDVIGSYKINRININSNGSFLNPSIIPLYVKMNVSRHHYDNSKSDEIFGEKSPALDNFYNNNQNVTLQCLLMDNYIDSVSEIKKYINYFTQYGIQRFSFRGLSKLNIGKGYNNETVQFYQQQKVDIFDVLNKISKDDDFEFVQQKIGDHYIYEIYLYKGIFVYFTYSNFSFLKEIERRERMNRDMFSRATILKPDGSVYTGWYYSINRIY